MISITIPQLLSLRLQPMQLNCSITYSLVSSLVTDPALRNSHVGAWRCLRKKKKKKENNNKNKDTRKTPFSVDLLSCLDRHHHP